MFDLRPGREGLREELGCPAVRAAEATLEGQARARVLLGRWEGKSGRNKIFVFLLLDVPMTLPQGRVWSSLSQVKLSVCR